MAALSERPGLAEVELTSCDVGSIRGSRAGAHSVSVRDDWPDTEEVLLSGGLVLADGRRREFAVLRPLSGLEEQWLTRNAGLPSARVTSYILGKCLVGIEDVPGGLDLSRSLLVGDRDFLMLQLRRMTVGDVFNAVAVCPGCGEKMDFDVRLADVPVEGEPAESRSLQIDVDGRAIRFRLPTGADQEAVSGMPLDDVVTVLLDRCFDGSLPFREGVGVGQVSASLSDRERDAVIAEMERVAPRIELEMALVCPYCSHQFVEPFDTTAHFLAEMRIGRKQLMREVHSLAFYYHWSEAEILGLSRPRRREYLDLLHDSVRGDRG